MYCYGRGMCLFSVYRVLVPTAMKIRVYIYA